MTRELTIKLDEIRSGGKTNGLAKFLSSRPDLIDELRDITADVIINGRSEVSQRLYHVLHGTAQPSCRCGLPRKFRDSTRGYYRTCGAQACARAENAERKGGTNTAKYGSAEYFGSVKFRRIRESTVNPFARDDVKEKIASTNLTRYGVKHPMQNADVARSAGKKLHERNLSDAAARVPAGIHIVKLDHGEYTVRCDGCGTDSVFLNSYFNVRLRDGVRPCLTCAPVQRFSSTGEREVSDFVSSLTDGVLRNVRSVPGIVELDVLVPDRGLAVEFNGLYWHSELFKGRSYHYDKREACEAVGIRLYQVWQDDWNDLAKRRIVESQLAHLLGASRRRVHARQCVVEELSYGESSGFFAASHIQGAVPSSRCIALAFNGDIVAAMSFGVRSWLGGRHDEMLRFCTAPGVSVPGAASRLLAAFGGSGSLYSYAALDRSAGGVYERLGFSLVRRTGPNYWWVVDGRRRHRYAYRKSELVRQGHDPSMTEVEIMHGMGHYRIFDSGAALYRLDRAVGNNQIYQQGTS